VSKRKLLLADDSITIQKVVNLTFADEGIEVISVGDGDAAMRKFDEFMPDLVMADVNMPGLNGYEVCRIIKRTEETQSIPVILLVGSFEPFDEAEAKDAGADDFLTKPFQSIRQLVNKVTDLLNRSSRAQEETPQAAAPVVDSFAETIEINREELPAAAASAEAETSNDFELGRSFSNNFENPSTEISSEFGDAGMDDEMIEASPANDYVSDSDSVYQRETTIDYAKTQPLNAEDLKGFEVISGGSTEQPQASETFEVQQPLNERREEFNERAEPASFDEEARKLNQTEDYNDLESYPESQNEETAQADEAPESAESSYDAEESENISETEPQIDYYLPSEPEFEKEITDAETLAPDVSYEPDGPREADFSQAETEDETTTEQTDAPAAAETNAEAETPTSFEEDEIADRDETEQPASEFKPETTEAETPQTFAANFAEEPETAETTVGFGSWEQPVSYSETEPEKIEQAEQEKLETTETESAKSEETVQSQSEAANFEESPEPFETETAESQENIDADETAEPEKNWEIPQSIDETPISASENAPALDFDDGDLLELPPLVEETGIRPQPKTEALVPEVVAATAPTAEPEPKITLTKTVAESEIALSFPPELIEAIAQAVADKISAKTMTDVLPQITELVMKKLAEENQENKK
jgi:DNA-binding response OmpR family regulator